MAILAIAGLVIRPGPAMTADSSDPLPTVKQVLKQLVERSRIDAENDRQFDQRYDYRRLKTREVRTTKGKLKQREVTTSLNQSRSPGPSAGKHKERDRESRDDPERSRSHGEYGKKDFPITDELLSRFDFSVAGREILDGRSALILDFKPAAREVPAKGYLERFANRMAGRLWVDETEAVIAKAELRLTETVTFIAGIAGAVYQLDCAFKRSRLDDGLWYTPEFTWSADWRELLSRKVVSVRETKEDLRPAKAAEPPPHESTARIELP